VVVAFMMLAGWLLVGATHPPPPLSEAAVAARTRQGGDVELYKSVVARVRAGQGYYDAAEAELRARAYPVRPAFNWRQPTYAWLLSKLPSPLVGSALLGAIALSAVWLTRRWFLASMPGAPTRATLAAVLVLVSTAGWLVGNFIYLQEAWAGSLIALSMCAFALDRWRLGLAASLAALAFRELALLPCAVGLVLALRNARRAEVAAWLAGLAAWAALLAWHFARVAPHLHGADAARGWLAFGGAAFIHATAQWSPLLIALPEWGTVLALSFALLGLAGSRDPGAPRVALVVFGYLFVFAFVGHSFNEYWGALYAPLLPFGLMAAPASVRDLARALRG
jgi:hypothetical protein